MFYAHKHYKHGSLHTKSEFQPTLFWKQKDKIKAHTPDKKSVYLQITVFSYLHLCSEPTNAHW
jgi:hypothetical protein